MSSSRNIFLLYIFSSLFTKLQIIYSIFSYLQQLSFIVLNWKEIVPSYLVVSFVTIFPVLPQPNLMFIEKCHIRTLLGLVIFSTVRLLVEYPIKYNYRCHFSKINQISISSPKRKFLEKFNFVSHKTASDLKFIPRDAWRAVSE